MSDKFILLLLTTVLAVALTGCGGSRAESNANNRNNSAESAQPEVVDVTVAAAVSRELPQYFEATGSLTSDAQTDVAPTVGGKVTAVNFDVGSFVGKGSVLVQLDDRDARIRLEQAQAQVAQLQSGVAAARANVEQARAGVAQTQARLGLTTGQNFNVNDVAEVKSARANLDLAERELRRNERLLETGDVSRSQYDQRRAQRDQVRAQYDAALNTAQTSFSAIRTSQTAVEGAQANVATAQRAVDSARTQIDAAQKAIADAVVYAPISGYISERNADLGEFVGTQNKIATIVRTNPLRLQVEVPEQSISNVRVGQSVSLQTSSYPDRNFNGTIARILPGLNTASRTLIAQAEVDNSSNLLKPGQFATVRVLLPEARPTVMIPANAVRQEGTTSRVFVVRDGRAEQRLVQLGETEGELVEVRSGVAADERVVTSNLELLVDGVEVRL